MFLLTCWDSSCVDKTIWNEMQQTDEDDYVGSNDSVISFQSRIHGGRTTGRLTVNYTGKLIFDWRLRPSQAAVQVVVVSRLGGGLRGLWGAGEEGRKSDYIVLAPTHPGLFALLSFQIPFDWLTNHILMVQKLHIIALNKTSVVWPVR